MAVMPSMDDILAGNCPEPHERRADETFEAWLHTTPAWLRVLAQLGSFEVHEVSENADPDPCNDLTVGIRLLTADHTYQLNLNVDGTRLGIRTKDDAVQLGYVL